MAGSSQLPTTPRSMTPIPGTVAGRNLPFFPSLLSRAPEDCVVNVRSHQLAHLSLSLSLWTAGRMALVSVP